MSSPLSFTYHWRHLVTRPISSLLTCFGVALVIFVFTATQMLGEGVERTLQSSGSPHNLIVLRGGSQNELQSGLSREDIRIVKEVATHSMPEKGAVVQLSDVVVLMNLPFSQSKSKTGANVTVRGMSPIDSSLATIRPPITILQGKNLSPGTNSLLVGAALAKRFGGLTVGSTLRLGGVVWKVDGIFSAGNTSFNSEIWTDVEVLLPILRRENFSSTTIRIPDSAQRAKIKRALESDPRIGVTAKQEDTFYSEQSAFLATFIRYLGAFISIIFSSAAIVGSMITLYTAIASRTREIRILRMIGFQRSTIIVGFIQEALLLSLVGGVLGIACAYVLTFFTVGTTNFQTFSDVTFTFVLSSEIVVKSFLFSIAMGVFGGALPAYSASRISASS